MKFNINDICIFEDNLKVKIINHMSINNDTMKVEIYTGECLNSYSRYKKGDCIYFNGDSLTKLERKSYLPTWL